ncbi:MAG: LamG domain-containing protein [Planctomycetota bacterium]|jgi:hypothetical protein
MKKKYLQPQVRTGSDTILHLKTYEPLTSGTDKLFDYSLNSHIGTLKGTAVLKFPGCDLDGDSDYIEVADHADFTPALTALSVSSWIYMDTVTNFAIASKGVLDTDGEWVFTVESNDFLSFLVMDESVATCYIGRYYNSAMTGSVWTHVVATYDGGTTSASVKLYINGAQVDDTDSENNAGSFVSAENLTHAVWIGRYSTFYANGKIDDVLIFNAVKSATEIKSIYETTRWRYGV